MTREQRASVLDWKFKHRNDKKESTVIIGTNGEFTSLINDKGKVVIETRGNSNKVKFVALNGKDGILVHNHPDGYGASNGSLAKGVGAPLSSADIQTAARLNLSESEISYKKYLNFLNLGFWLGRATSLG